MAQFNSSMCSYDDKTGTWTMKGAVAVNSTLPDSIKAGGVKLPQTLNISVSGLVAASTSLSAFVADNAYQIVGVQAVFGTPSTSGTLQVEVATGTQAVGGGANQLTGAVSLAGAANTVVGGTLIASPTQIASGDRINLILAGTLTSLANCCVTITLQRV